MCSPNNTYSSMHVIHTRVGLCEGIRHRGFRQKGFHSICVRVRWACMYWKPCLLYCCRLYAAAVKQCDYTGGAFPMMEECQHRSRCDSKWETDAVQQLRRSCEEFLWLHATGKQRAPVDINMSVHRVLVSGVTYYNTTRSDTYK